MPPSAHSISRPFTQTKVTPWFFIVRRKCLPQDRLTLGISLGPVDFGSIEIRPADGLQRQVLNGLGRRSGFLTLRACPVAQSARPAR